MPTGPEIYVFEIDDDYLFTRFFDDSAVFDALREFYARDAYRFEVPADEYEAVADTLRDYGYEPTIVDDPEPFCVCIDRYETHADILRESVANWTRRGHRFFLMKDPIAVEQAVQQGADLVADTEFEAGI